jgi:hypothetical protein
MTSSWTQMAILEFRSLLRAEHRLENVRKRLEVMELKIPHNEFSFFVKETEKMLKEND